MDLAFDVAGRGQPVLLLHGLFASSANWRRVADALSRTRRVYSVDLRNHGRSPASADMSYCAMADDVLRLIERESLERPALVGHSMGGKVAMALALATPWAVGRLVVIEAAPRRGLEGWTPDLVQRAAGAAAPGSGRPGSALMHWMLPRQAAADACFDWRCRLGLVTPSLHELAGFPALLRCLSTRTPLHAIVAGRSGCVCPPLAATYRPMFPRTRVHLIEQAGHWVHADRPDELVARLDALLPSSRRRLAGCLPALRTQTMETTR